MNRFFNKLALWVIIIGSTACQAEEEILPAGGSETKNLTIRASIEGIASATKSLDESEQSMVETIDVMMFYAADESFAYAVQGSNIVYDGSEIEFELALRESSSFSDTYIMVVLANADSESIESVGLIEGVSTLEDLENGLVFTPQTSWQSGDRIAMWCQMPSAVAVTATTLGSDFGNASLIRALARINITNSDTDKFTLLGATVFNAPDKALAIPSCSNFSGSSVSAPSVPSSAQTLDSYSIKATNNSIEGEIFVAEAENSSAADDSALYIVIEGCYLDNPASYYRIDIADESGRLDILRNHTYDLTITKVAKNGASSIEEAASGDPSDSPSSVTTVWNDSDLHYIFTDGVSTLAIDALSLELSANGGTSYLFAETDNSDGYTVAVTGNDDWDIRLTTSTTRIYLAPDVNRTGATRECTMTVAAGNISIEVVLSQSSL